MKSQKSALLSPIPADASVTTFGAFIRHERKRRKLTQAEFSQAAGIAHLTLHKIECGKSDSARLHGKVIKGLARALRIAPDTLKSLAKGESFSWNVVKICERCWKPATPPDSRWTCMDSHFCALCGHPLREECQCGQPIILEAKFCLNCGKNYDKF